MYKFDIILFSRITDYNYLVGNNVCNLHKNIGSTKVIMFMKEMSQLVIKEWIAHMRQRS